MDSQEQNPNMEGQPQSQPSEWWSNVKQSRIGEDPYLESLLLENSQPSEWWLKVKRSRVEEGLEYFITQ